MSEILYFAFLLIKGDGESCRLKVGIGVGAESCQDRGVD